MKKVSLIIFYVMIFVLATCSVNAQCTNEEIDNLKKEANKIKVTYKHLGAVEVEGGVNEYNHFSLTFKNLGNDMYIKDAYGNLIKSDTDFDSIVIESQTGTYKYYIYSGKCGISLKALDIKLPRFNIYSLDSLCDGIDVEKFELCGKYYEYDVPYEIFKKKIEEFKKNTSNVEKINNKEEKKNFTYYINYFYNYIQDNLLYFSFGVGFILLFLIILLVIKNKKNRGVLK